MITTKTTAVRIWGRWWNVLRVEPIRLTWGAEPVETRSRLYLERKGRFKTIEKPGAHWECVLESAVALS